MQEEGEKFAPPNEYPKKDAVKEKRKVVRKKEPAGPEKENVDKSVDEAKETKTDKSSVQSVEDREMPNADSVKNDDDSSKHKKGKQKSKKKKTATKRKNGHTKHSGKSKKTKGGSNPKHVSTKNSAKITSTNSKHNVARKEHDSTKHAKSDAVKEEEKVTIKERIGFTDNTENRNDNAQVETTNKKSFDNVPDAEAVQVNANEAKEKPDPFVSVKNLQKQRQFAMNTAIDKYFDNHEDYEIEYTI